MNLYSALIFSWKRMNENHDYIGKIINDVIKIYDIIILCMKNVYIFFFFLLILKFYKTI